MPPSHTVVPNRYHSFAAQHPLVTIAGLGAAAGLTFASTAYLTSRLAGRLFRARSPVPPHARGTASSASNIAPDALLGTTTSEVSQRALVKDLTDELEKKIVTRLQHDLKASLESIASNSAAAGAKSQASIAAAMGERLGIIEDQIVAANRDRRTELQGSRNELMGHLAMMESHIRQANTVSKDDIQSLQAELAKSQGKVSNLHYQG